ncbi:sodium-translocating pyrophosphatase [bacterium]|nr:MAG: sodium-translocating pyrophosphatase [bacterium]QQR62061.1 MAG: sodium-translocating pyrophosphatase [bacterium]QQR62345.1 MAG: sodium-translocating pyrophosphatase [bacterium]
MVESVWLQNTLLFVVAAGCLGLLAVLFLFRSIYVVPVNHKGAANIAQAICQGAMAFLKEEYKIISFMVLLVGLLLGVIFKTFFATGSFALGALSSMLTGFVGMRAATMANVRTTMQAKEKGEHEAFLMAFFGGGVMGFAVASFGLLCLSALFYTFSAHEHFVTILTCFSLGASLVAFFARVGGGIFTKSADVGADLVGKVEVGIPEDDPRNPAVIADNVGDCVGDTAGMGADIYESYVGALVSTIILALNTGKSDPIYVLLPLVLAAMGMFSSLAGLMSNLVLKSEPAAMLRNATYVAIGIFLCMAYGYMYFVGIETVLFATIVLGCVAGVVIGLVTEYYTGSTPVHKVAASSESGAATNVIYGLSVGMESTVLPVVLLSGVVLASYQLGGLYGVSLAAVAMLATVGITMTVDAYGPIADNAGGISEMAGFGPEVRAITDKLDALGNTTAAIGKGFAIGSALLTALAMLSAYCQEAAIQVLDVLDPFIMTGMFVGATVPFLISSFTMRSVSDAALKMVKEVRRQFKEIPGLMAGEALPDYKQCVVIATQASLYEMILPGVVSVGLPILVRFAFGKYALGGLLIGATVSGVVLALMMANSGGVWDNAKKYIEAGNLGGKGSVTHKAAVIGDTVGDPFKDTSGPALNILIKLMSVVSLLLVLV